MKAIVRFGYEDYCFDVSAVPLISTAIKVKSVRDGYHPDDDFGGVEIKLIPDEKVRITKEEQDKDYKAELKQYEKWWLDGQVTNKELKKKVEELTTTLNALKAVCPHPENNMQSKEEG